MERKLTAILSADVKGYSRLMGDDEIATVRTLTAYREVMTDLIQAHRGRVVDSPGDNLLAEFSSVVDAVQCATKIQQELTGRNVELPSHRQMAFRIGINVGDVLTEDGRLYGDGVNIAARLEGLAEAGGICISEAAYAQVKNKLALGYEYIGEQQVKNIAEPVRAYKVQMEPDAAAPPTTTQEQPAQPLAAAKPTSRYGRRAALTVAVLLVVGVGGLVLKHLYTPPSLPPAPVLITETPSLHLPDKPSIVVLPFSNMSNDLEQEYFSDGITEDITTGLAKLSSLFVIARNSAFTYKGKAVKVQDVSHEMGVQYVLEGSVRKADNQVRVTVQLVDGLSGSHLWAERFDRPLQGIFAVQDEIVQKIVTTLKLQLTLMERGALVRKRTDSLEAYDSYLRGIESYGRAWDETKKEANAQARQMFEKAIALDPTYAEAYAQLGATYWFEWLLGGNRAPQILARAGELAQQAMALDESLPMPHVVLGTVYLWKRQHEQAITEARRAVALDPNNAGSYLALGSILMFAGRTEEAIESSKQAMRLHPHYPPIYLFQLSLAYRVAGQYEEALEPGQKVASLTPNMGPAHFNLAIIYSELGRMGEAQAEVAEMLRLSPNASLKGFRQILPFKDPAVLERHLAALRKAGLK
jgi:adenylate cyclase